MNYRLVQICPVIGFYVLYILSFIEFYLMFLCTLTFKLWNIYVVESCPDPDCCTVCLPLLARSVRQYNVNCFNI